MFSTSTQKRHWMFDSIETVDSMRRAANERFITESIQAHRLSEEESGPGPSGILLTTQEEKEICHIVLEGARKFCLEFRPPMPSAVMWASVMYFKRFYLKNSVMEHVPKSVMLGCMYLACKVEEFNVSIDQFVDNLKSGSRDDNTDTILSYELELMYHLNYELAVHAPFRALEGLIIDIKTRCPDIADCIEPLRRGCEQFLLDATMTDAMFLYPPSQIALAALLHSSSFAEVSLDIYCRNCLATDEAQHEKLMARLQEISILTSQVMKVDMKRIDEVMKKLRCCIQRLHSTSDRA